MRSLPIPPNDDGPCIPSRDDPATLARFILETDSLDVVSARALGRDRVYVMHIDDWGKAKSLPLNRRAWALYGGSPIYGWAILSADDRAPIDPAIVALVNEPDFPPTEVRGFMDAWLEEHP